MLTKRDAVCALFVLFFLTAGITSVPSVMAESGIGGTNVSTPAAEYDFGSRESPISILLYTEYADMSETVLGEYSNTNKSIRETYGQRYVKDNLDDYTQLGSMINDYDVIIVVEQEKANSSVIDTIAAAWSGFLVDWIAGGGVFICMGYWESDLGVTHRLLNSTGLMELYSPSDRAFAVVDKMLDGHALAFDVSASFSGPDGTVGFSTPDGDVVFQSGGDAVVIDKVLGQGHAVMLGFDFFDRSIDTDKILANAIRLTKHVVFDASNDASYDPLVGFEAFGLALAGMGFAVSTMSTWNESLIGICDIFVAAAGNGDGYSAGEVALLEQFVANGGGLLVTTDWGNWGNNTDTLLAEFGFVRNQNPDILQDSDEYDNIVEQPYYDLGENLANHSVTFHTNRIQLFASSAFNETPATAVPLIWTDSDGTESWAFSSDSAAGLVIGAAAPHGAGRVIAITDGDFLSDADYDSDGSTDFFDEHNEVFSLNMMCWLLAAGLPEKTLLVDNSHSSYIGITNSAWSEFGMLLTMNGFNIMWMNHFSEELIDTADALLLLSGSVEYIPDEVSAIVDFVARGGGLFTIGDNSIYSTRLNNVTSEFGLVYNDVNGSIWEDDDYDTYHEYIICDGDNFANHPIMNGVHRLEFDKTGGFSSIGSGVALCSTDDDGTAHWYLGGLTGEANLVPLIAATEYSLGRVVGIADYNMPTKTDPDGDTFYTLFDSDNAVFLANAFYWLIENRAPIVEVIFPNGGEVLNATEIVEWTAVDPNRDALTFEVYYSDNNGSDWTLLAGDLTGFTFEWNTTLHDDGDSYMIRVVAFDGYLESSDDSDGPFELDNFEEGPGITVDPMVLLAVGVGVVALVIIIMLLNKRGKSAKK